MALRYNRRVVGNMPNVNSLYQRPPYNIISLLILIPPIDLCVFIIATKADMLAPPGDKIETDFSHRPLQKLLAPGKNLCVQELLR